MTAQPKRRGPSPHRGLPTWGRALGWLLAAAAVASCSAPPTQAEELPEGVEQILPRGRIAAVFKPRFVSADAADIAEDAWVLGVAIEGEARAYSLNLLNRHEVVNDKLGNSAFAAVW